MSKSSMDAETGKWLSNKTVAMIVVFFATFAFFVGQNIPIAPTKSGHNLTNMEQRFLSMETAVSKQEATINGIKATLDWMHEDIKELRKDIRALIAKERKNDFKS